MTTSTASPSLAAHDEPRLIIPQLASFYEYTPGLSWLIVRLTAGGMLLVLAIITFVAHWAAGFVAGRGGWEYPLFWGLIMFAIALRGGGPYSVDRRLRWEL